MRVFYLHQLQKKTHSVKKIKKKVYFFIKKGIFNRQGT